MVVRYRHPETKEYITEEEAKDYTRKDYSFVEWFNDQPMIAQYIMENDFYEGKTTRDEIIAKYEEFIEKNFEDFVDVFIGSH